MRPVEFMLRMIDRVSGPARRVEDRLRRIENRTARVSRGVGGALGSIFSGITLGAGISQMVKLTSDAQELKNVSDTVFGDLASGVYSQTDTLARSIGRVQGDLTPMVTQFGLLASTMGFTDMETKSLALGMTGLAADLGSFYNKEDPEVLERLRSGLVGNHEVLREFGVMINEAALNQELLNRGIKGGSKAASEQEKFLARLAIVTRQTNKAQGDAAKTQDDFAALRRRFNGRLAEQARIIGARVIPMLESLLRTGIRLLDGFGKLPALAQNLTAGAVGLGLAWGTIGPIFSMLGFRGLRLSKMLQFLRVSNLRGLSSVLKLTGGSRMLFRLFGRGIPMILRFGRAFLVGLGPIGWIITALTLLVPAVTWAYKNIGWFRDGVNALWDGLRMLPSALAGLYDDVTQKVAGMLAYLSTLPQQMLQRGRDAIAGFISGITGRLSEVTDAATLMGTSFVDRFTGFFKINSPSRLMEQLAMMLPAGERQGIEKGINKYDPAAPLLTRAKAPGRSNGGGGTYNITINVQGAGDAQATARAVALQLAQLFDQLGLELGASGPATAGGAL